MVSGVTFKDKFANALLIKQQRLSTCFECVVCCRAIKEKNLCMFRTQNSPENFRNELYQRGSNQGFRNPPFRILGLGPLVWRLWAAIFDYRPLVRDLDSKIVDWGSLVQCLCIGMTNMGSLIWVDWLGTSFSYFCGGIVGSKSLAMGLLGWQL